MWRTYNNNIHSCGSGEQYKYHNCSKVMNGQLENKLPEITIGPYITVVIKKGILHVEKTHHSSNS